MKKHTIDYQIDEYFAQESTQKLFSDVNDKRVDSLKKMKKYFYTFLVPAIGLIVLVMMYVGGEMGFDIAKFVGIAYVGIGMGMHQLRIRKQGLESSLFNDFLEKFLPDATYGKSVGDSVSALHDQIDALSGQGSLLGDITKVASQQPKSFSYVIEKDNLGKPLIEMYGSEQIEERKNQEDLYYMNYTIECEQTRRPVEQKVTIVPDSRLRISKIKMEDQAFEKIYDVKCKDDTLARMVLTPNVMQALVDFATSSQDPIKEIVFFGKQVTIKRQVPRPIISINRNYAVNREVMSQAYKNFYNEIQYIKKLAQTVNVDYFGRRV